MLSSIISDFGDQHNDVDEQRDGIGDDHGFGVDEETPRLPHGQTGDNKTESREGEITRLSVSKDLDELRERCHTAYGACCVSQNVDGHTVI